MSSRTERASQYGSRRPSGFDGHSRFSYTLQVGTKRNPIGFRSLGSRGHSHKPFGPLFFDLERRPPHLYPLWVNGGHRYSDDLAQAHWWRTKADVGNVEGAVRAESHCRRQG
jgi:hypothetical protein